MGDQYFFDRVRRAVVVKAVDVIRDTVLEPEATCHGETTDQDELALEVVGEPAD